MISPRVISGCAAATLVVAGALVASTARTQEPPPGDPAPNLIGLTISEAEQAAAAAGMTLLPVRWKVRPGMAGRVIAHDPAAGGPRYWGSDMRLDVSTGLRASRRPALEFRTTGGAAYCQVETAAEPVNELVCWHPRTGRIVTQPGGSGFGRATSYSHKGAIGTRPAGFRTVGFGASWRQGAFNCHSSRQALKCTGPTSNFSLGRVKGFKTGGY